VIYQAVYGSRTNGVGITFWYVPIKWKLSWATLSQSVNRQEIDKYL